VSLEAMVAQTPGRTVHHRAAHEGGVRGAGDFRAVDAFIARVLLRRLGFAGQQCLIDEKIPGLACGHPRLGWPFFLHPLDSPDALN
jgi:hypothetical protein